MDTIGKEVRLARYLSAQMLPRCQLTGNRLVKNSVVNFCQGSAAAAVYGVIDAVLSSIISQVACHKYTCRRGYTVLYLMPYYRE